MKERHSIAGIVSSVFALVGGVVVMGVIIVQLTGSVGLFGLYPTVLRLVLVGSTWHAGTGLAIGACGTLESGTKRTFVVLGLISNMLLVISSNVATFLTMVRLPRI